MRHDIVIRLGNRRPGNLSSARPGRCRRWLVGFWALAGATLPATAAPPLEAYGYLPAVEDIQLSPSGERFASITVVGEQRQLIVVAVGGKVLQRATIGNTKTQRFWWAGDDHILTGVHSTFKNPLLLTTGQAELMNVADLAVTQGKLSFIFQKNPAIAGLVRGYYGWSTSDGRTYGYFGGMPLAETAGEFTVDFGHFFADVYRVDLDSGKTIRVATGSPQHGSWVLDRNGEVVAHEEYDRKEGRWWLYAGDDRKRLLLERTAPIEVPSLLGAGRRPGTVLIDDPTGDRDVVIEVDVAGESGRVENLVEGDYKRLLWERDGDRLLLGIVTDDAGYATIYAPILQARLKSMEKAFSGYRVSVESFSRDFSRLVAFTDGGDDSGTYWAVDMTTRKADPVGYAYPKIRAADVGSTRMYEYKAADGLSLDGVLTLPPGRKTERLPIIVMPHGGPLGASDGLGFDWWAQAFASRGYAVFQPNFRGSGGHGAEFRLAGYGEWGGKMLSDIADGLHALVDEGIVDPRRACIVGGSYGGYAALAGVTVQQGLYRCAVSVAGVADLPAFLGWIQRGHGANSYGLRFTREAIGVERGDDDRASRYSPRHLVSKADAPVLLIHGLDDSVVPVAQSEIMEAAMKQANKPVEFIRMKGEDHWLSRSETRAIMLKAAVEFVQRHNPAD